MGAQWPAAVAAAWLTFLLGMALRHRPIPRPLVRLGVISYSVYLLHLLPLQLLRRAVGDPAGQPLVTRIGLETFLFAVVVALGLVSHRYVEQPMQRLGKRLRA